MDSTEDRGRRLLSPVMLAGDESVDPRSSFAVSISSTSLLALRSMLATLLQCPACDDTITLPTTLTCGHTVCSKHVSLSPTESAAALFTLPALPTSSSVRQLPSCPILTCYNPANPRPLRTKDIAPSLSSDLYPDDPVFPPVVYIPPPNDRRHTGPVAPPPLAQVKIPNPKLDVTLQRVLEVLERMIDLRGPPTTSVTHTSLSSGPSHSSVIPENEMGPEGRRGDTSSADVSPETTSPNLESQTRSRSPSPRTVVHNPRSDVPIPGAFVTDEKSFDLYNHQPADAGLSEPPAKRRRRISTTSQPSSIDLSSFDEDAPLVSKPIAGQATISSELEKMTVEQRDALTSALLPEMTCDVCFQLFYDPVTTPCQHTFCSQCLLRSLDHSALCPLCREVLPGFAFYHDHPSNEILLKLLKALFPVPYAARKASTLAEEGLNNPLENVPIFPCTLAFPNQPISLNIFEPRYRLMIRRVLANGTNTFGMTLHPNPYTGEEVMYGTMLRIKRVQMHVDGQSAVDTIGTWRFKIIGRTWLDGYMVATIERITDYPVEIEAHLETMRLNSPLPSRFPSPLHAPTSSLAADSTASTPAQPTPSQSGPPQTGTSVELTNQFIEEASTEELAARCLEFVHRIRGRLAPWVALRMDAAYGKMPTDSTQLSFWMALVLPIDDYDKGKLLSLRSPRLRLQLVAHWIAALDKQGWWHNSGFRAFFALLVLCRILYELLKRFF